VLLVEAPGCAGDGALVADFLTLTVLRVDTHLAPSLED
jgi:hypothetical protein